MNPRVTVERLANRQYDLFVGDELYLRVDHSELMQYLMAALDEQAISFSERKQRQMEKRRKS